MAYNVLSVSEVPNEARNLGEGDSLNQIHAVKRCRQLLFCSFGNLFNYPPISCIIDNRT
jgi:hypothetical protein